ncbi:hypothetical protein L313_1469 [Acinetobacter haemolyticus CIP 64.3 = MTCC 9819]|uniref:Uncharacterized protein n=2 Tax=Acinetobacter TaxID=469 RepID=A0A5P1UMP5_9GAMM|nr:hypothetical protein BSR56_00120 [Acinetobacter haemolyticus]EPR89348.1 hypothetical protein L313_1469 [Acinetobacter haemolyticus CIP 64.3 = MTCC 9819]QER38199.1 hypothetical protein F2A31_00120 [Acinetobacter sp. C16S1]AZN67750.1 hypothetical protein DX910_05080 [Acinetobacter haemolyticus]NCU24270.1 hypothetical protein [Acinetobacter haemolyticus]
MSFIFLYPNQQKLENLSLKNFANFCPLMIEQYPFLFIFTVNSAKKICRSSLIPTQLIIFQLNRGGAV